MSAFVLEKILDEGKKRLMAHLKVVYSQKNIFYCELYTEESTETYVYDHSKEIIFPCDETFQGKM